MGDSAPSQWRDSVRRGSGRPHHGHAAPLSPRFGPQQGLSTHRISHTLRYVKATTARALSAAQTRERLIDAAIERFADQGVGASFDVVAADIGVTKGALYHHFGSKNGLVEAVYREAIKRHATRVIDASTQGSGRERIFGLIDASTRLYTSGTPFYRLLLRLHLEAAADRTHLTPIARKVQHNQRAYMADLIRLGQEDGSIRPGLDPESVGYTVNAALQGFLVEQFEPPATKRRWVKSFRRLMEEIL
jgi:AcrR family transcriptional regulator